MEQPLGNLFAPNFPCDSCQLGGCASNQLDNGPWNVLYPASLGPTPRTSNLVQPSFKPGHHTSPLHDLAQHGMARKQLGGRKTSMLMTRGGEGRPLLGQVVGCGALGAGLAIKR